MFDLKWFAHGLNIFNLTKGNAPEETFANDTVTPQIVQAHAQQRASAREIEEYDHDTESYQREKRRIDQLRAVNTLVAADRVAHRRTLAYIEQRWREGASCDDVFSEVNAFRIQQYDLIVKNRGIMLRLEKGFETMRPEQVRKQLVEDGPISKK